ncbi:MAG: outer membrane protein assembly factor BamD [Tepidisphaera sp.]|nr:outer membrane protein assembly factor BamD [Tepidisphaera sp.]
MRVSPKSDRHLPEVPPPTTSAAPPRDHHGESQRAPDWMRTPLKTCRSRASELKVCLSLMTRWLLVFGIAMAAIPARAQTSLTLDPDGQWRPVQRAGQDDPDAKVMDQARRLLAERKPEEAFDLLDGWMKAEDRRKNPYTPEALLLKGQAKLDDDEETNALREWEEIVKNYPESEQFVPALENEFEVAKLYINGLSPRVLGLRIDDGKPVAEEIILRINERLPGSKLAEKALITLADMYYRIRDLPIAVETYDVFLRLYPRSAYRSRALQRRAFATIAQFRGPGHDPSGLLEARYQIEDFQREFPSEADRLGMSDALVARLDDSAAAHLLEVAQWYADRGDVTSQKYILGRLITKHPGSGAAVEALATFDKNHWPLPGAKKGPDAGNAAAPAAPDQPAKGQAGQPEQANPKEPTP